MPSLVVLTLSLSQQPQAGTHRSHHYRSLTNPSDGTSLHLLSPNRLPRGAGTAESHVLGSLSANTISSISAAITRRSVVANSPVGQITRGANKLQLPSPNVTATGTSPTDAPPHLSTVARTQRTSLTSAAPTPSKGMPQSTKVHHGAFGVRISLCLICAVLML